MTTSNTPPPFPRATAALQEGISAGLHLGAQLFTSRANQVLCDLAIGESQSGVPMSPDSLNLWMSSSKPIAAVAVAQLWEQGKLELDDRVADHVPEFAHNGKDPITLRHILTHTAGFRTPPRSQDAPWDQIIAELCAARLEPGWVPGEKAGYHPVSSWFILGEIVRRVGGLDYGAYVRRRIFEPLGMLDAWIGMPTEKFESYGQRIAPMHKITSNHQAIPLNARATATSVRPGSSGWGPIRQLARFYQMLDNRGSLDGARIISPQSVEALTARHRTGMFDHTFKRNIDWGLGFLLNAAIPDPDLPYAYGPVASPRTFGHGGAESSGAFCDPQRHLVVAYVFNGQPGEERHHHRRKQLLDAIEEDLAAISSPGLPACGERSRTGEG
jgi:CubicO group peptidase (beta-lactamase class C family)